MTPETRACTFLVWRYLDLLEQRDSDRFFAQPPSYCVQLPSMRNIVIGMLKLWENQEFHARRPSLKTPLDLGILWERLNLFHWPYHVAEEIRLKRRRLEHAPAPAMDAPLFAKLEADSQAFDGVNPRSMIGVTSDRTVYMVVVDGRQSGKADGLTIPQMAQLAKYLGLVDAINLDGGGSSTLWVKGKGVINTPSGGSVRKVPNIIIAK
jgi:hypothetical protein